MDQAPVSSEADANRRPLKTRGWAVFGWLARWLGGAGVSPDAISLASILFGVVAGLAFWGTSQVSGSAPVRGLWVAAALFIQLRLIANLLDGMVAIEGGKKSPLGPLYNEVPDRLADAAILLGAGYAAGGDARLGAAATIVAFFVAYVRAMGTTVGVGQVFLGPMAKPHRMALLTAASVVCAASPVAWRPESHGYLGVIGWSLAVVVVGGLITSARRLVEIARRLHAGDQAGGRGG